MTHRPIRDSWLLPTLDMLLPAERAEQLRMAAPESCWEWAVQRGLVTDDEILTALASRLRLTIANLGVVSPQAREIVPEHLARKYRIVPLACSESALDVATADPYDIDCERTLAFATGRTVRMALASPLRIAERIDELYRPESVVERLLEHVSARYEVHSLDEAGEVADLELGAERADERSGERPVIRLVDHILAEGVAARASDIHIEPEEGGVAVRFRIDGVLRRSMALPRAIGLPLVSRIKIISGLDIADRLRPQDGRARVAVNGARIDLRVSTLPAAHGEKVVVRILDNRGTVLSVEAMGITPEEMARVQTLLDAREGIVLVTGPTGSGKTTTLYSLLRHMLARGGVNVVTVEDPVEYRLQGIVQVQVNERAGLTFAAALRSILRQDPDVVLVGEIRDGETAGIAVQASLTGHLVLSTLHTADAASAVTRLVDVGAESYKIATALKGVIAQRLLRRVCPSCRELHVDAPPERLRRWLPGGLALYRAVGCSDCAMTGYRGRFAILEVLASTPELERRIAAGEPVDRLVDAAREGGMRTLWETGLARVRSGDTTLDELLRVVEVPAEPGTSGSYPRVSGSHPRVSGSHPSISGAMEAIAEWAQPRVATPVEVPELDLELVDELAADEPPPSTVPTILLVEDETNLRRALRDVLERSGFRVVEATDGVTALDEVDRAAPDAIVLDLDMPRLDGFGVLRYLRRRAATAAIPVLVLTAKADEETEVRVFEAGASDYLAKPLRARSLGARIRSLLKRD